MSATLSAPTESGPNIEQQQPHTPMPAAESILTSPESAHQETTKTPATITRVRANENQAITRAQDSLDETNWAIWRHRLELMLQICGVLGYVHGTVPRPDPSQDPEGAGNWDFNDTYAKVLITNNVSATQMVHISRSPTARDCWSNLEAVHDAKSHQTTIGIIRNLYRASANEGDNIADHLNFLKRYWERINLIGDDDFTVSDNQFKVLISSSLPSSWDTFTEGYVGRRRDVPETDPKKLMSSQQFIGIIKEEAIRRETRKAESSYQTVSTLHPSTSKAKYCVICKRKNHNTSECRNRDNKKSCSICNKPGHEDKDCWYRDGGPGKPPGMGKRKRDGKPGQGGDKKQRTEAMNVTDDNDDAMQVEEVAFTTEEDNMQMNLSHEGQSIVNTTYANNAQNDKPVVLYDWLADTATTSHISNQLEAFATYQPLTGKAVAGVGNNKAKVEGRGTIELESLCNGNKYLLKLDDVLYIPSNRNNLISLGRWDTAGGRYIGGGGSITLITKDGRHVAHGIKVENNLYKMKVSIRKPGAICSKTVTCTPQTFQATEPSQSWEIWHKRYGHIGYSGLQRLLDLHLVDGFTVDTRTPKPDCVACTEAKQTEEPFGKKTDRVTKPGELTHIDVWGKYRLTSINGNQYYIVFVDDAGRFVTINFMKAKSEAVQRVKDYLTHLKTQEKPPKAIRFDCGKEFLNAELETWCAQQGIEIQTTAPYSPPQNGIAERMNRTIVELARAMLNAHHLPQFLWEYAVAHAVYLRNRAYTKPLGSKTPYSGSKNCSNVCSFVNDCIGIGC